VGAAASLAVQARREVVEVVAHPTVVRCRRVARREAAVGAAVAAVQAAQGETGQDVGEGAGDVTVLRPAEQAAHRVESTHLDCVRSVSVLGRGAELAARVYGQSLSSRIQSFSACCPKVSCGLRSGA
jgi:hypothetical protein